MNTRDLFFKIKRHSEVRLSNSNIRHGLVDGLHSVTHGKLIYNLLGSLLKVDLPCIIPFGIRDLHHTVVLDIRHIVEEVLQRGKCERVRETIEGDRVRVRGKAEEKANKRTKRKTAKL